MTTTKEAVLSTIEYAITQQPRTLQTAIGPNGIPCGLCQCGCGEKTWIATRNIRSKGIKKGDALEYKSGHRGRVKPTRWFGDDVEYWGAHDRVYAAKGKASDHDCQHCGQPACHWAYDHADPNEKVAKSGAPFSPNPDYYRPLCLICHRAFDAPPLATHCGRGHLWTEETTWIFKGNGKRRCRICHRDNERNRQALKRKEAKAA